MITVTGRTFDYRDLLKSMGGRWNNADRNWQFLYLDAAQIATLAAMPGLFVVGNHATPPAIQPSTKIIGDDPTFFNYFADQNPTVFFGFSSVGAFADHVAALDRPAPDDSTRDDGAWRETERYRRFTGTDSMAHALDLARNGWIDGIGMGARLTVDVAQSKRRQASVAGGVVSVERMLSGDPRHMIRRTRQPGRRNVRLFVAAGMAREIGQSVATFRALLIGAMVDLLETNGYRCELIAVSSSCHVSSKREPRDQFAIRIKDARDRLNLLDMTFALGHPSFSRRLIFACADVLPELNIHSKNAIVRPAFDTSEPMAPNEFYISAIHPAQAATLTDDPMSILPFIEPNNLPIKIKGIE